MKKISTSESISMLIFEVLDDVDFIVKTLPKKVNPVDVLSISLFFTMIGILTDINHLIRLNRYLSVPALVRNFMDAHIDLMLVLSDSKNVNRLLHKVYNEKIKTLEGRFKHKEFNSNHEEIKKQIVKAKSKLSLVKKQTESPKLEIKDKFKAVGLGWFYDTIYKDLCSHTHNGLDAIELRHVRLESKKVKLKHYQSTNLKDYVLYISIPLNYLPVSVRHLNTHLKLKCDSQIEGIESKIQDLLREI